MESRNLRRGLSIVASAALVAALTAVTSGAITPGESFNVSPSQGAPFTVISVSGANCVGQSASAELEDLTGDDLPGGTGAIPGADVVTFAAPDGAGNWSGNITIPPVVAAGQYRVVASCGPVAYAPQPFEVLAGDLASMSVSPTQATAGTDVVVSVSGTLCRGANAQVDVGIPNESTGSRRFSRGCSSHRTARATGQLNSRFRLPPRPAATSSLPNARSTTAVLSLLAAAHNPVGAGREPELHGLDLFSPHPGRVELFFGMCGLVPRCAHGSNPRHLRASNFPGRFIGRFSAGGFVFAAAEGGPVHHRNFKRRHYARAVEAVEGLPAGCVSMIFATPPRRCWSRTVGTWRK